MSYDGKPSANPARESAMSRVVHYGGWAGAALLVTLSPALIAFGAPFAYGIGSDLGATAWLAPIALILGAAVAINAVRRSAPQAAKSMT
jgi:hypothetical protein